MRSIDSAKSLALSGLLVLTLVAGSAGGQGWSSHPRPYNGGYGSSDPNLKGFETISPYNSGYDSPYPANDAGYNRAYAYAESSTAVK